MENMQTDDRCVYEQKRISNKIDDRIIIEIFWNFFTNFSPAIVQRALP